MGFRDRQGGPGMKACILLIEGTNCEDESVRAFKSVGIDAEKVHLKQLTGECVSERMRNLDEYDALFIPGGWSAGDYIRAGAIFAARMKAKLGPALRKFTEDGRIIVGVCNGFQVLVESGLLPGFDGISERPEAVLTINASNRFQCRPSFLKHVNKCSITSRIPEGRVLQVPVAHAEGRLSFGSRNDEFLGKLVDGGQIVFRYCRSDGVDAEGEFPWNPNGSLYDIAGICNPEGSILGMMPHPERVIEPVQQADWTRKKYVEGEGRIFFESIRDYLKSK
ncbi:MAG: phosphoribosylformylglycinamidine synthase subunit PurQ [Candidatus Altiarchaeota archaeon]